MTNKQTNKRHSLVSVRFGSSALIPLVNLTDPVADVAHHKVHVTRECHVLTSVSCKAECTVLPGQCSSWPAVGSRKRPAAVRLANGLDTRRTRSASPTNPSILLHNSHTRAPHSHRPDWNPAFSAFSTWIPPSHSRSRSFLQHPKFRSMTESEGQRFKPHHGQLAPSCETYTIKMLLFIVSDTIQVR